jgi:hypothetical protein
LPLPPRLGLAPDTAHAIQNDQPGRWLTALDGWMRRFD